MEIKQKFFLPYLFNMHNFGVISQCNENYLFVIFTIDESLCTSIVSLPITRISFHGIIMSSSLPKRPKKRSLPNIIIEVSVPLSVSSSISETKPNTPPSPTHTTCLLRSSSILQVKITTSIIYMQKKQP